MECPGLVILHPDTATLREAMKHWDPDKIFTGGYCEQECEKFWSSLAGVIGPGHIESAISTNFSK